MFFDMIEEKAVIYYGGEVESKEGFDPVGHHAGVADFCYNGSG